jgi:hypothetical protein
MTCERASLHRHRYETVEEPPVTTSLATALEFAALAQSAAPAARVQDSPLAEFGLFKMAIAALSAFVGRAA